MLCKPSEIRRLPSVSGRHDDDRLRNASDVFRKAYAAINHFQSLPTSNGNCQSPLDPCYVKGQHDDARFGWRAT